MQGAMDAYEAWADIRGDDSNGFRSYAFNIAEARYVVRRVTRIINEEAKKFGLDPLLHQALLQVMGTPAGVELAVGGLADRLDIAAAFASRLVSRLESLGLLRREPSVHDRRAINVMITDAGIDILKSIDDSIYHHVAYFQQQLSDSQRKAALSIFAFWVGVDSSSDIASAIRASGAAMSQRMPSLE